MSKPSLDSFGDQVISLRQGPMLIGFLFNVLLYGMMIAQLYVYYTTYKKFVPCFLELRDVSYCIFRDHRWMKLFVHALFISKY